MTAPLSAPSVRRRLAVVAACAAAAALTAGCTAHMDMTISPADTYDVVMEMRDTTGTVFTADTDCSAYADPALVGEFRGAQVSARAIGSVDDDDGVGCEVRVTGVAVPGATQAPQGAGLVVHDGDLYVVDLTALAAGLTGGGAPGAAGQTPIRSASVSGGGEAADQGAGRAGAPDSCRSAPLSCEHPIPPVRRRGSATITARGDSMTNTSVRDLVDRALLPLRAVDGALHDRAVDYVVDGARRLRAGGEASRGGA
mgnify:CR=1 FL=1